MQGIDRGGGRTQKRERSTGWWRAMRKEEGRSNSRKEREKCRG